MRTEPVDQVSHRGLGPGAATLNLAAVRSHGDGSPLVGSFLGPKAMSRRS
jgi:hypothetical protein